MKPFATTAVAATLAAGAALASETAPGDVVFDEYGAVEVSLTGAAGDPQRGAEIITARSKGNCIACHEVTALKDAPFHGEVGPILDGAGSRWTEAELRGLVANSKMTFDGTVMPAFYKTTGFIRPGDAYTGKAAPADLPPILTAQEIEDVVAYLATLKDE
ncbi:MULTISPECIES: sulfur oxidation c-type cytochrome SoxX [unclassified Meridianimarinicoccus]|uniref:sulfur oxidation c-type cytochrome SoxX n=1 Tax=unclassified Meridianimarinicoccus TaxID=2923344 RepID=UPI001867B967|nr:sulfur oxidation c-type cytochrome SoxX [Fluviibacterium sp. MJW13]